MLPPTAVRAAQRSSGGDSPEAADAAAADAGESGSERGPLRREAAGRGGGPHGPNGSAAPSAGGGAASSKGGKKASWWRRLYGPKHAQWQDYRLEQLPPGCKPVLVFVNTKSGPQAGALLRRRFLRCLHPLQVGRCKAPLLINETPPALACCRWLPALLPRPFSAD